MNESKSRVEWQPDPKAQGWSSWVRTVKAKVTLCPTETLKSPHKPSRNIMLIQGEWGIGWAHGPFRVEGCWPDNDSRLVHVMAKSWLEPALQNHYMNKTLDEVLGDQGEFELQLPIEHVVNLEAWAQDQKPDRVTCRLYGFIEDSRNCMLAYYRKGKPPRLVQSHQYIEARYKVQADAWLRQAAKELDSEIRAALRDVTGCDI